jgi:hypothetical protein
VSRSRKRPASRQAGESWHWPMGDVLKGWSEQVSSCSRLVSRVAPE